MEPCSPEEPWIQGSRLTLESFWAVSLAELDETQMAWTYGSGHRPQTLADDGAAQEVFQGSGLRTEGEI